MKALMSKCRKQIDKIYSGPHWLNFVQIAVLVGTGALLHLIAVEWVIVQIGQVVLVEELVKLHWLHGPVVTLS